MLLFSHHFFRIFNRCDLINTSTTYVRTTMSVVSVVGPRETVVSLPSTPTNFFFDWNQKTHGSCSPKFVIEPKVRSMEVCRMLHKNVKSTKCHLDFKIEKYIKKI